MYETDEIKNIKTAVHNLADNGNSNQLIIGDLNSSLNRYLDYMENPNLNLTMEENDTNPRLTTATG